MKKILGLDYGEKRIGIAETDNCQIIANGLTTVKTSSFFIFFTEFIIKNSVEKIIVGMSKNLANNFNSIESKIFIFLKKFINIFPKIPVYRVDERFTSKIAYQSLYLNKMSKKKKLIDQVSAALILQSYLNISHIDKSFKKKNEITDLLIRKFNFKDKM